jgi:hypothetical protein
LGRHELIAMALPLSLVMVQAAALERSATFQVTPVAVSSA